MARLSNAERQRRYRERHLRSEEGQGERLNVVVHLSAKRALEQLAVHWGTSQREALERVLREAQGRVLDTLDGLGQEQFYDKRRVTK